MNLAVEQKVQDFYLQKIAQVGVERTHSEGVSIFGHQFRFVVNAEHHRIDVFFNSSQAENKINELRFAQNLRSALYKACNTVRVGMQVGEEQKLSVGSIYEWINSQTIQCAFNIGKLQANLLTQQRHILIAKHFLEHQGFRVVSLSDKTEKSAAKLQQIQTVVNQKISTVISGCQKFTNELKIMTQRVEELQRALDLFKSNGNDETLEYSLQIQLLSHFQTSILDFVKREMVYHQMLVAYLNKAENHFKKVIGTAVSKSEETAKLLEYVNGLGLAKLSEDEPVNCSVTNVSLTPENAVCLMAHGKNYALTRAVLMGFIREGGINPWTNRKITIFQIKSLKQK
ncbi:MAG: hypothetical protein ACPGUD_04390 [Parashewanella sp.]